MFHTFDMVPTSKSNIQLKKKSYFSKREECLKVLNDALAKIREFPCISYCTKSGETFPFHDGHSSVVVGLACHSETWPLLVTITITKL